MDFMEPCRSEGKYQAGTCISSVKIIWDFRFLYTKWSDFDAVHGIKKANTNPAVWLKINSTRKLLRFINVSLGSLSVIHRHYHQQVTLYLLLLWPLVLPRTYNFISFSYWNSSPLSLDMNLPHRFSGDKVYGFPLPRGHRWISPERCLRFRFLKELQWPQTLNLYKERKPDQAGKSHAKSHRHRVKLPSSPKQYILTAPIIPFKTDKLYDLWLQN